MDGAEGLLLLPDKSIKLVYGSPPYPNAKRDYGIWKSADYIDKIAPFLDASCLKLADDGFIVINVKANRETSTEKASSKRSLIIEKLAVLMEERWHLHCVDIEIWIILALRFSVPDSMVTSELPIIQPILFHPPPFPARLPSPVIVK